MGRKTPSGKAAMEANDEKDPVLIPSLPEPWEGLVRKVADTAFLHGDAYGRCEDVPVVADIIHDASRAEHALRVALGDLLRDKWFLNGRDSDS